MSTKVSLFFYDDGVNMIHLYYDSVTSKHHLSIGPMFLGGDIRVPLVGTQYMTLALLLEKAYPKGSCLTEERRKDFKMIIKTSREIKEKSRENINKTIRSISSKDQKTAKDRKEADGK